MFRKILRLPETVVNQIAAGEVVENPASIVKELIENSIDAGACRIAVEINGGGQQLIRIEDDGCGMGREDAMASLERHATSKIRTVEDLSSLATMGFRGEALAAISSVSQFEMMTGTGAEAIRIAAQGGRIESAEPCARNRGTTIWVRSLFFNVPARKKFQKSASANASQVRRTVESLSLAHPEIAFSLISQGKKIIEVIGSNSEGKWKRRIEEIEGIISCDHEIGYEKEGIRIWGFAASPEKALLNRSGQHLFINRRPVFSPLISRAVKEGFATRIDTSSHPVFALFIEISPDQVDVNVHPQKKEVRFQNEGQIFRQIQEAVSASFLTPVPETTGFSLSNPSFSFRDLPWESPLPTQEILPFAANDEPRLEFAYPERALAISGHYLLLQKEDLLLIDLRAAHARILFESLSIEKGSAQALMWPLEIELKRGEEECIAELNQMGIECRLLGEKWMAVDALPPFLDPAQFPLFFAQWKEGKEIGPAACRFCRGMKKQYSLEEAVVLWRRLQQCSDGRSDPLGNMIWTTVKEADLEKLMAKNRYT